MKSAWHQSRAFCWLVWAALLLVPLLLAVAIFWPWFDRLRTLDEAIATNVDQVQRYQRVLATLPALRAELEQVDANQELKAFYFDAPTPALAGAELQRRLQEIVRGAAGRLISTQLLPGRQDEERGAQRVQVRAQLQGSTETLFDVLFEIEQARPFIFVDQLSVRSAARRDRPGAVRRRIRRAALDGQHGQLTMRVDVFGFAVQGRQ